MSSGESVTAASSQAVDPNDIKPPPLEKQIAEAIEQLAVGDFHSQWDYAKQFSRQFAQWGDRIIPPLIYQLKTQQDPDTQWFLIRILSQFEHPTIVTALAQLLVTTHSEELQIEVSKALSTLGESAIKTLSDLLATSVKEEQPGLDAPLDLQLDAQRILAARTLAYIRRSAVIEPLLSIVDDPHPELRAIAIEALGSFHDARITPVLLAALKDKPPICIEAIRTLGRRRDLLAVTDLITPLTQCLLTTDETVASESATALGRLGSEAAITALGERLITPLSTHVKVAIVRALGWLNVASSVSYLANAFQSPMPEIMPVVKKEIARALGQTREEALRAIAAAPLIEWIKASQLIDPPKGDLSSSSETWLILQAVLSSLARLGATDAVDSVIPILSHPDPRLRLHALNALKQIDPRTAQAQAQNYLRQLHSSPVEKQYVAETLAAW